MTLTENNTERLNSIKKEFIQFLEKYKTKESSKFNDYRDLDVLYLIQEFGKQKSLIESNMTMAILMLCDELGIDMNANEEIYRTIRYYTTIFIEISKVLGF